MTVITGGPAGGPTDDTAAAAPGAVAAPSRAASNSERIVDALLECIGRWGADKTTVEDVARLAGLSRATVYRVFPGGKPAMMQAAMQAEVARLVDAIADDLERAADLEECLAIGISSATSFLRATDALDSLREHELDGVETMLVFDRLDGLLAISANALGPLLARHVDDPALATEVAVWAARIVVSYLTAPAPGLDLAEVADARHLVHTYLMPGLLPADTPDGRPASPASTGSITTLTT